MRLYCCFSSLLCVFVSHCFAVDREAFSFTKYDLNVRIEPEQQRLGVRGAITLRNDSPTPQKIAVLQISSSLSWRSIKAGDKQLQFVAHTYTSDIDHTGALSEAVVTLPEAVAPKDTVDLEIAYEGVIVLDATRLTRIGTPEAAAKSSDWDEISTKFTAVRDAGNVAWYPIATDAVSLAEEHELPDALRRWRLREGVPSMHFQITETGLGSPPDVFVPGSLCAVGLTEQIGMAHSVQVDCTPRTLGPVIPMLVVAHYATLERPAITVRYFRGHDTAASTYADTAQAASAFITEWFGPQQRKAETTDQADVNAPPIENGSFLLTPLVSANPELAGLAAAHQLTHASFYSPRPWINEGLAHFAQVLYLEQQSGRQAALDYLHAHSTGLLAANTTSTGEQDAVSHSLINLMDEGLLRSKAMCVWWMLREMVGDKALKKAIAAYRPEQDTEPSYMQRLVQAQTQEDLEWFFDDWVYRDRGLPDFKVESAFVRKTLPEGYMVTVTVANSGTAGAEVPVTVKFAGGEVTPRVLVRAKSNAVVRVATLKAPEKIVVNDGGVPESDKTNNLFKIQDSDIRDTNPGN